MSKCQASSCGNPIWSHKFCRVHQNLRTDSKWLASLAKAKEKRNKPIAKVSTKKLELNDGDMWKAGKLPAKSKSQAKKDAIYFSLLPGWKLANPVCAWPGCERPTAHCHHARGRLKYYLVIGTWRPLCEEHHHVVEMNPDLAKAMNLSELRLANYEQQEES